MIALLSPNSPELPPSKGEVRGNAKYFVINKGIVKR